MARYGRLLADAPWEKIRPLLRQQPSRRNHQHEQQNFLARKRLTHHATFPLRPRFYQTMHFPSNSANLVRCALAKG